MKNTLSSTKLITLDESTHQNKKNFKFNKLIPNYEKNLLEFIHVVPIISRSIDFYLKNITSQRYIESKKFDKHATRAKTILKLIKSIFNFTKYYSLQQNKINLICNIFFTKKFNNMKYFFNKTYPSFFTLLDKSVKNNIKKEEKLEERRTQF